VSLVIVNYNSGALTANLVAAVGDGADDIVVVDNHSPDGGAGLAELEQERPDVKVVRSPTNRGYGAGANEGARHTSGDVLVISNPDITISGPDLRALAAEVGHDDVVLAAPRFVTPEGAPEYSAHRREPRLLLTLDAFCRPFGHAIRRVRKDWHPTWVSPAAHAQDLDVLSVLGALLAIDRRAFDEIGGFDEAFFMYREEDDLCRRLRQHGGRIRHVGHLTATHIGRASTPSKWGYQGNVNLLESHYRYITKHWGRLMAAAARAIGIAGSAVWVVLGRRDKAPLARRVFRWHVGLPIEE
jgi:GT2 family glycosyltransferase